MGYQITRPAGNHDQQGGLRRQPVAEHRQRARLDRVHLLERRHCAGASERDRGRRGRLRSAEHHLLGDRAAVCPVGVHMAGEDPAEQITVYATEAQGPSITPVADPGSLWDQTGHWIWNAPGDAWPLPVAGADSSGVCSLSVQVGASAPIADSVAASRRTIPAGRSASSQRAGQRRSTRATTSAVPGSYP